MWRGVERRLGISAPQMKVSPHVVWYVRWGMILPFVFAAIAMTWWAYDSGLEFAGFNRGKAEDEIAKLSEQVANLELENAQLSNQVAQDVRQLQIEQASHHETLGQIKSLTDENTRLQEDLVFFQHLTAPRGKKGELGVHRLTLERDKLPGEYHLRMLLVQSGQRAKEFRGRYQLVATVRENGMATTHAFPQKESENAQFGLNFKYYQRVEQNIQLPPAAKLEGVQVRIFKKGELEPKVRQDVSPS